MNIKNKGFTLIELVAVIVVIAILAAIAIPYMLDLRTQARVATLTGFVGAVNSVQSTVRAQALISGVDTSGTTSPSVTVGTVVVPTKFGWGDFSTVAGGTALLQLIAQAGNNQTGSPTANLYINAVATPTPAFCYSADGTTCLANTAPSSCKVSFLAPSSSIQMPAAVYATNGC